MAKVRSDATERRVGVVLNYIQLLLTAVSGILYTPIMIRMLGGEGTQSEYGLYNTVLNFIGLLGLLNMGFSNSYIRFYSKFKAKGEYNRINSFNALFFIVFLIIAMLSLVIGLFFSFNLSFVFDTGLTADEYVKARIMMIMLTVSTALSFSLTVFGCYIGANQRFIYQRSVNLFFNILNIGANLVVLFAGFGAVGLVLVTVTSSVLSQAIYIYYAFKQLDMKFDFKNVEKPLFKEVFAFSGLIAINLIVDKINTGIDSLLLARIWNTATVKVYAIGASLNGHFTSFSLAISGPFVPRVHELVNAYEQDSKEQRKALTEFFVKVGRIQFLLLALLASGIVIFGDRFIYFWAGEAQYSKDSYYIALIMLLPSIISLSQNVGIEIQRAMNRHHYRSYLYGLTAIINLVSSYIMCKKWGGIGCAIGTGGACIIATIILMNIVYNNKINIEIKEYWKNIGRQTLGMLPAFFVGALMMMFVSFDSIPKLILFIGIYTAIYLADIFFLSMNQYEKDLALGTVKKVLRKIKK